MGLAELRGGISVRGIFLSPLLIDLYGEGESFQTVGMSGSSQAGE